MSTKKPVSKTPIVKERKIQPDQDQWILRLYVAGKTQKSVTAFENLKKICEERLKSK